MKDLQEETITNIERTYTTMMERLEEELEKTMIEKVDKKLRKIRGTKNLYNKIEKQKTYIEKQEGTIKGLREELDILKGQYQRQEKIIQELREDNKRLEDIALSPEGL